MIKLLTKLGVNALAIWVAVTFVDGLNFDGDWPRLLIVALVLGLVNAIVKPVVKLFSFPALLATLGLFLIVINIAMFAIVVALSDTFELGLSNDGGFLALAIGGFIVSLVAWVAELVLPND